MKRNGSYERKQYRTIFGLKGDPTGRRWLEFLPELTREETAAFYRDLSTNPRTVTYEHPVTIEGGEVRHYQWIDTPIFDAQHQLLEFQSVGIDITERRQAEEISYAQRDLARIIGTTTLGTEAWPQCLAIAMRVTNMDSGGIYLFDSGCRTIQLVAHHGLSDVFLRVTSRYPIEAPSVQMILAGTPVYSDVSVLQAQVLFQSEGLCAVASVPIQHQGRVVGCLNLASHTLLRVPSSSRHALDSIATEIGSVMVYMRTEAALRASEELYRTLITSQESTIATLDADGVFHYINQIGAAPLTGSPETVIGRRLHDFFPPQLADQQFDQIRQVITSGQGVVGEIQHQFADPPRWYHASVQPLRDANGTPVLAMVNALDITARKQVEEALHAEQLRFAKVADTIPGAVCTFLLRPDGTLSIPYASKKFEEFYGLTLADVHENIDALIARVPLDQVAQLVEAVGESARTLQPWRNEYRYHHPHKGEIWLEGHSMPIRETDGSIFWHGFVTDITERKRAEEQLRESEHRFSTIFHTSPVGIIITRLRDNRLEDLNTAALTLFGYRREELIGRTALDVGLWAEPGDRQRILDELRQHQEVHGFESMFCCRSGERRFMLVSAEVIELDGAPSMLFQIVDITERKRAEQALLELNQTLEQRVRERTAEVQDLYENAPVGYHVLDASGTVLMVNQTQLDWLGYTREEMLGQSMSSFLTPDGIAAFAEGFPAFQEHGSVRDVEFEMVCKDGSLIPVLLSATAVYDEQGAFLMTRSSIFNNSERKQAEIALRESEAQNRLLFEESPDAVVLFRKDGTLVQLNRAFEQLTGYSAPQMLDQRLDRIGLVSHETYLKLAGAVSEHIRARTRFAAVEVYLRRASGEVRDVGMRIFSLSIRGQQHYLTTMRDITTEKQVAATLRQANTELARAARAKDEFLANMSHELRTPLNAILGLSETLLEEIRGALNPHQQGMVHNIESSGRHLLALITDILDLSKVEAGQLELQLEPVIVAEVCQASLLFVKELAAKKALRLSFTLNDQLSTMEADGRRLKQMLVNLLSNAVKFTPAKGTVCLEVDVDSEAEVIRFAVQDTGIGIAAEDLARLFQPFKQLDSSLSRQHEGTGLGLALVRRLAKLHGGSVTVESAPDQGSRFTISLPYRIPQRISGEAYVSTLDRANQPTPLHSALVVDAAERAIVPQPEAPPPTGAHILLVEDNEVNILTISDYIQSHGYALSVARNGREALSQLDKRRPDLILMDIQMPELDGLETTRRLRAIPAYAQVPIIALTALVMPGDRERCLEAGANDYMTKPVSLKALAERIRQLLTAIRSSG